MNVAHDLDRLDNAVIVARGRDWITSSKISTGSVESMVRVLATVWLGGKKQSSQM